MTPTMTRDRVVMLLSLLLSLAALALAAKPRVTSTSSGPHRVGSYIPGGGGGTPGGSANEVQINNGAGGFGGATNVTAGTSEVAIGVTTAAAGALRLEKGAAIAARNNGGTGDVNLLSMDGAGTDIVRVGDTASTILVLQSSPGNYAGVYNPSFGYYMQWGTTNGLTYNMAPIVGDSSASPYSVHGMSGVVTDPNGGVSVVSAADYAQQVITVCHAFGGSAGTGGGSIQLPAASSASKAYTKWIFDGCNGGAFIVDIVGGGSPTPTIGLSKIAGVLVTDTGVYRLTADQSP